MNRLAICVMSVLTLLTGCQGVPGEEAQTILAAKAPCCKQYTQLEFKPALLEAWYMCQLTSASPAMSLPRGKSFIEGVSLPQHSTSIFVQSLSSERDLPFASYVDVALVVLDRDKTPIATYDARGYSLQGQVVFPALWEWFYGVKLALPDNAAYLVVGADANSRRNQMVFSDSGQIFHIPPSPIGTIAIMAQ